MGQTWMTRSGQLVRVPRPSLLLIYSRLIKSRTSNDIRNSILGYFLVMIAVAVSVGWEDKRRGQSPLL